MKTSTPWSTLFNNYFRHRKWPGEGFTMQRKRSHVNPGSLKAHLLFVCSGRFWNVLSWYSGGTTITQTTSCNVTDALASRTCWILDVCRIATLSSWCSPQIPEPGARSLSGWGRRRDMFYEDAAFLLTIGSFLLTIECLLLTNFRSSLTYNWRSFSYKWSFFAHCENWTILSIYV